MDEAERAIVERVAHDAAAWFPGTPADPTVHLRPLGDRRRSRLYDVIVGDPADPPLMVAKIRHAHSAVALAGPQGTPGRPTLAATTADETELTALEFAALAHLETVFPVGDPRFGTVRPLAHLAEHHAIIMERAPGTPMRELLARWSRLHLGRRRGPAPEPLFRAVGAWLRTFHDATPTAGRPARQATAEDVAAHFAALEGFLGRRLGRQFGDLAGAGSALAAQLLPRGVLPLAVGHGDFAPRNVVVDDAGRVVVLDPLARWAVPAQEDLCRFLVGVQLNGLQLHTRGAAYAEDTLGCWQRQVVEGYYGADVPWGPLRCYQLLVLLDKWSALLEPAPHGGVAAAARTLSQQRTTGYVRRRAQGLLDLARSANG